MQFVKQHDNLQSFTNAASITSGVRLDKILAVPFISLVLTAESLSAQARCSKDPLSSTGGILSNTDLSDLSTVGTCDIFVYQMRHRVM